VNSDLRIEESFQVLRVSEFTSLVALYEGMFVSTLYFISRAFY